MAATQNVWLTSTAVAQATVQKEEDDFWTTMVKDGSITQKKGILHTEDNFNQSWAQRNWYRWWPIEQKMGDFVIMTHIDWSSAQALSLSGLGGCGFVLRMDESKNHLVVFLTVGNGSETGSMNQNWWTDLTPTLQGPDYQKISDLSKGSGAAVGIVVAVAVAVWD
jgi:hypothetical protein